MNLNFRIFLTVFSIAIIVGFSSCDKDDDVISKPVISGLELGIDNSHVTYIGADLHIEAEIVAQGKINSVSVEIHQEEGSMDEIYVEYDEFAGLKNTTFHEHIDIPEEADAGDYHFHMTVTDMEGNQTTVEEEISIEELEDVTAPVLTVSSSPDVGEIFVVGDEIFISGTITDNSSLAGMVIALVYKSDSISDADVLGDNNKVIVMLHTHTFDSEISHSFTASIEVGATNDNNMQPTPIQGENAWKTGDYYILAKGKDVKGNWTYSSHYNLTLND